MNEHHWQILARQHLAIATIGWAVTGVIPDPGEAPYAYTVGLTDLDAPELVIAGLPHHIAHTLLNDMAGRVHEHGARWHHHDRIDNLVRDYPAVIIDGTATDLLHPGTANARYGADQVRLQQIVWPDPDGHLRRPRGAATDAADHDTSGVRGIRRRGRRACGVADTAGPRPRRSGRSRPR